MRRLFALAVSVLACTPFVASAVPITYQLQFTVTSGSVESAIVQPDGSVVFNQTSAVGNTYFGSFGLDSSFLSTDGMNRSATLDFFSIQMEDNIWGFNSTNNSLVGFRGPTLSNPGCTACVGALSPGFDILNGDIVALHGGVYGMFDVPFVDFLAGDTFEALGGRLSVASSSQYVGTRQNQTVLGSMRIVRIPEPGSALVLFGLGAFGLALVERRVRR